MSTKRDFFSVYVFEYKVIVENYVVLIIFYFSHVSLLFLLTHKCIMLMKTRTLLKSIVFCMISIFSMSIHAQISTKELSPSFSTTLFSIRSSDVVELAIPVDCNLQNSAVWQR